MPFPTRTDFYHQTNGHCHGVAKPFTTSWTDIHYIDGPNEDYDWHQVYLWISNPNNHSIIAECQMGECYDTPTNEQFRMTLAPKSGWHLFSPGMILRSVPNNNGTPPGSGQQIQAKAYNYGSGFIAGFVNNIPAPNYDSTEEGLFALNGTVYNPGSADEPAGSPILMKGTHESNYKRTIHTAVSGTSYYDEIWLWACCAQFWGGGNLVTGFRELWVEWGSTTENKASHFFIPPDAGWVPVVQGLVLHNGALVRGWAEDQADAEINVGGYVWRKAV